ncbi:hypothetical protein FQN50_002766 [Emmonsiellopsis sp. PD_5]|nr:hypothetical protein FQN50_002766 [Emmonsiellopsis sp. PD_5]
MERHDPEAPFYSLGVLQRNIRTRSHIVDGWDRLHCPIPLHADLRDVYTLDLDAGHLTVSRWRDDENGIPTTFMLRIELDKIQKAEHLLPQSLLENARDVSLRGCCDVAVPPESMESVGQTTASTQYEPLNIKISRPSKLNEIQYQVFIDFTHQWCFYIDDHSLWPGPSSPLFKMLAIAYLRIAAWDLEVSDIHSFEIPMGFQLSPGWKFPEEEIYWFHGFLIVLCKRLETEEDRAEAIKKAEGFLLDQNSKDTGDRSQHITRAILISLRQIVVAEFFPGKDEGTSISCSNPIPLLTEKSAIECSPGFRVLAWLFTASEPSFSHASRERWGVSIPLEILDTILKELPVEDIPSFCQASSLARRLYYSSGVPQMNDIRPMRLPHSIPCCGSPDKNYADETEGISCSSCYTWRHTSCAFPSQNENGANATISPDPYICPACSEKSPSSFSLHPNSLNLTIRTQRRKNDGCHVLEIPTSKCRFLQSRHRHFFKPHMYPIKHSSCSGPAGIPYAIRFGWVFVGVAYSLDRDGEEAG